MRCVDLNQPEWQLDDRQVLKGNRIKYAAILDAGEPAPIGEVRRWVWKTSKPTYPLEFWSEIIASEIAAAIGLAAPCACPAKYEESYGALMEFMTDPSKGETLYHGGDFLLAYKPEYDRVKGRDHSIQLIDQVFPLKGFSKMRAELFKQFVFDAVIGNQDRHQDNWGLIIAMTIEPKVTASMRLAPAFDNGSSLGRELLEPRIIEMLNDPTKLERYIERGLAHVRWEEDGKLRQVSHEEFLQLSMATFERARGLAMSLLRFDTDKVSEAIRRVCALSRQETEMPISPEREAFLVLVTQRRIERLRAIVESE